MSELEFNLAPFITYHLAGHFEAPGKNWCHMMRELNDYELFFVTKGTLYIADEESQYTVCTGEYLIMPPTSFQHGTANSDCSFYWLHFDLQKGDSVRTIQLPMQNILQNASHLSVLFTQFHDIIHHTSDEYALNLSATGILYEVYQQTKNDASRAKGYLVYEKILGYISWNQEYKITVQELARHIGYHPKYISSVFHQFHGCTLKKYLMQLTMEYAKTELVNSRISITALAQQMGFSDAHNFSSAFKTSVGISPGEYRRSYKEIEHNHY